jgi:hypothetical protein
MELSADHHVLFPVARGSVLGLLLAAVHAVQMLLAVCTVASVAAWATVRLRIHRRLLWDYLISLHD